MQAGIESCLDFVDISSFSQSRVVCESILGLKIRAVVEHENLGYVKGSQIAQKILGPIGDERSLSICERKWNVIVGGVKVFVGRCWGGEMAKLSSL